MHQGVLKPGLLSGSHLYSFPSILLVTDEACTRNTLRSFCKDFSPTLIKCCSQLPVKVSQGSFWGLPALDPWRSFFIQLHPDLSRDIFFQFQRHFLTFAMLPSLSQSWYLAWRNGKDHDFSKGHLCGMVLSQNISFHLKLFFYWMYCYLYNGHFNRKQNKVPNLIM